MDFTHLTSNTFVKALKKTFPAFVIEPSSSELWWNVHELQSVKFQWRERSETGVYWFFSIWRSWCKVLKSLPRTRRWVKWNWWNLSCLFCACSHPVVFEQLQDEGDGAAVDADEQVDAGQGHVGGARDVEDVGQGIHHGRHRPPARETNHSYGSFISPP